VRPNIIGFLILTIYRCSEIFIISHRCIIFARIADWIKPGAVVIDVGINFIDPCASAAASSSATESQQPVVTSSSTIESVTSNATVTPLNNVAATAKRRLVGDVDFAGASQRASWITRTHAFSVIVNFYPTRSHRHYSGISHCTLISLSLSLVCL
jgi:5,10-methylene-tetrahydrofolate dehydrogenase/methenyl tetrahydrofolate cyclohydrolase